MALKKCNCKKCVYCKQITKSTAIFRVNCEKYGSDKYMPDYCDQYTTEEEYERQQEIERDCERQIKYVECILSVIERRRGK